MNLSENTNIFIEKNWIVVCKMSAIFLPPQYVMNHEHVVCTDNVQSMLRASDRLYYGFMITFTALYITLWYLLHYIYRQTSNIRHAFVGNKIVDHSDVVGASPAGASSTTSSFSTSNLASVDWEKTTARRDGKHLSFEIWCVLYKRFQCNCSKRAAYWSIWKIVQDVCTFYFIPSTICLEGSQTRIIGKWK